MSTPLPLSPFVDPDCRFMLDEDAFMAAIEPPPAFIDNPSNAFMRAVEIRPIVDVLAPVDPPEPNALDPAQMDLSERTDLPPAGNA